MQSALEIDPSDPSTPSNPNMAPWLAAERERRAQQEIERARASGNIDELMAQHRARTALESGERLPTAAMPAPLPPTPPDIQPGAALEMRNPPSQQQISPGTAEVLRAHDEPMRPHFERARTSPSAQPYDYTPVPEPRDLEGQRALEAPWRNGAVSSSTAEATTTPTPAPAEMKPGGVLRAGGGEKRVEEEEPPKRKGARGGRQAAVADRGEFPDIVDKAVIDPQYLVRLEQSNPQLHDAIVSAAAKAGVGSWEYANLIYATSKGDPNFRDKDGRMGIAGIKPEDVARYQRAYPDLFKDEQGNPINPMDPATNLLLGAQKFRELRDYYGSNTANSIAAYYHSPDKVNQAATLTPNEQRDALGADGYRFVREAIGGPNAEKGEAKALQLNPVGTLTAPAVIQAATQAARSGDVRGFFSVVADGLPRGMSSTDGWKHVEALGVAAMLMKGNVVGAQHVRELMFQMSHVGANQALMRARQMMDANDNVGAAQQLALAYWATPDGGMARIHITPQGIYGQRYSEATGVKVGAPFQITKQAVDSMLNQTRDPQTFLKTMQASQKHYADIDHKHAETAHKRMETVEKAAELPGKIALREAQTEYYKDRGDIELTKSENQALVRIAEIHRRMDAAGGPDARAEAALRREAATLTRFYYPPIDPLSREPVELTEEQSKEQATFTDMIIHNRNLAGAPGTAKQIASGISKGTYKPEVVTEGDYKGYGVVKDKSGRTLGILSPGHMQILGRLRPKAGPPMDF